MFMADCEVPYCELYDRGYTSIGLTHNTVPNPALKVTPSEPTADPAASSVAYLPAHHLPLTVGERGSRVGDVPPIPPPAAVVQEDIQLPLSSLSACKSSSKRAQVVILYDPYRMGSYISDILTCLGSVAPCSLEVSVLGHDCTRGMTDKFLSVLEAHIAHNDSVIVLGDYSVPGRKFPSLIRYCIQE